MVGRYVLNSANAGQKNSKLSCEKVRTGNVDSM